MNKFLFSFFNDLIWKFWFWSSSELYPGFSHFSSCLFNSSSNRFESFMENDALRGSMNDCFLIRGAPQVAVARVFFARITLAPSRILIECASFLISNYLRFPPAATVAAAAATENLSRVCSRAERVSLFDEWRSSDFRGIALNSEI